MATTKKKVKVKGNIQPVTTTSNEPGSVVGQTSTKPVKTVKGPYKINRSPLPITRSPGQRFDIKHSTPAASKKAANLDRKSIQKVLGKDWRQQVFGDVKKYQGTFKSVKGTRKKIDKLEGRQKTLKEQVGTPGASDELIQRRIAALQERESKVRTKASPAQATAYYNKKRFQSAAKEATQTLAQKKAKAQAAKLKGQFGAIRSGKLTQNPNAPIKVQKRKKQAKKVLAKATKKAQRQATYYRGSNTGPGGTAQ